MVKNRIKDLTLKREPPRKKAKGPVVFMVTGNQNCFLVESEDKRIAYKVKWDGIKGTCTCADYQKNHKGNGYQCRHITAAKESQHKVRLNTHDAYHRTEEEISRILRRDFSKDKILYRPDGLKSIETVHVLNRLDEAFGPLNWTFKHGEPIYNGHEYTCNGRIDVHVNGKHSFRQQTGSCRCDTGNGTVLSKGDAQTGAIQMALKKCASLYGIGLNQVYKATR